MHLETKRPPKARHIGVAKNGDVSGNGSGQPVIVEDVVADFARRRRDRGATTVAVRSANVSTGTPNPGCAFGSLDRPGRTALRGSFIDLQLSIVARDLELVPLGRARGPVACRCRLSALRGAQALAAIAVMSTTPVPEFRGRRVLRATVAMALSGTVLALVRGGSTLCVILLIWLAGAGLLVRREPRVAMHMMWWGAIMWAVISFFAMISGFDLHHDSAPTELDDVEVAAPYFLALAVTAVGSCLVWLGRRTLPPRVPHTVPPARTVE